MEIQICSHQFYGKCVSIFGHYWYDRRYAKFIVDLKRFTSKRNFMKDFDTAKHYFKFSTVFAKDCTLQQESRQQVIIIIIVDFDAITLSFASKIGPSKVADMKIMSMTLIKFMACASTVRRIFHFSKKIVRITMENGVFYFSSNAIKVFRTTHIASYKISNRFTPN